MRKPALSRHTPITSNAASITGLDSNASISIDGGEYQIDSGDFTSVSGNINNNQSVKIRVTSGAYTETKLATLTIGTYSATFAVTTRPQDFTPEQFSFDAQSGVEPATPITSNAASITGLDSNASISIDGGEYQIDSGDFTSVSGNINNNQSVKIRVTSGAYTETKLATLTIGTYSATFAVTTRPQDFTPEQFSFDAQSGVEPGNSHYLKCSQHHRLR